MTLTLLKFNLYFKTRKSFYFVFLIIFMDESRIITPPTYLSVEEWESVGRNFIFLAGPIQGAADWQSDAIKLMQSLESKITVASPRRIEKSGDYSEEKYLEQVNWERSHLKKSWKSGVVMFWLAKETEYIPGRSYAQTSRFEIGESKLRHETNWSKLVVGIESGFSGERYIRKIFSDDCPDVHIYDNLKETCEEAVRLIKI